MAHQKLIPLAEWDAMHFSRTHSLNTLRKWAREGYIQPPPILVGSRYEVAPNAQYVPMNNSRIQRLRAARRLQGENLLESLTAAQNDPEMLEILGHGCTT
ncbi:excisionase [Oceanospirillum sediminis]|uniref:Excisionase n=1 Tax=Oceanospirillum sediminis TaxID=2760088 RepID=A0A839IVR1_9GAMM|nr:excisionase [Oceanospirillum sediminis]MBB1489061.1 excisionase [Oceanospirillum sediminis]